MLNRRFLPSTHLLMAFDAVARTESVTQAAAELALTQGAVSRQIAALEAQIGIKLFDREKKRLRLTWAGASYAKVVGAALNEIAQTTLQLKANPLGGTINLAILPTFGTRWLAPRLSLFLSANPNISINLSTRLSQFDFAKDGFDAAIHFGRANWVGAGHLKLMTEMVVPACSPNLLTERKPKTAQDILTFPLLHLESRPSAWENWAQHYGIAPPSGGGMLFDQFSTMIQAVVHGLGVALLPSFLIQQELASGQLASAFGAPTRSVGDYYLVWPKKNADYPPLVRFRAWLETNSGDGGTIDPAQVATPNNLRLYPR